jgi:ankyrin repeat protein
MAFVKLLLRRGAAIELRRNLGNALVIAIKNGSEDIVGILLEYGEDVVEATKISIRERCGPMVRFLIRRWWPSYPTFGFPDATLEVAIQSGFTEVQLYLQDRMRFRPELCSLTESIRYGYTGMAQLFIEHGVDVNITTWHDGNTPLMEAILLGDSDIVQRLIEKGACLNPAEPPNPLIYAARKGREVAVKLLLEAGTDINWVDESGNTTADKAIRIAKSLGHQGIVQILLAQGVSAPDVEKFGA